MAFSKSSTLFVAAIILSITVCQVSCMRHHHVERRAGDASKDMAKEECDMIANDMLQKYKDKPYTEARDPFLDFFKKCIIQLFDFQMEANPEDKDKENYVLFKNLPTFVEKPYEEFSPLTKNFGLYAKVIETFFTKAGEWNTLLKDDKMKTDKGILVVCKNLLYAVGARYAYYTYLLRHITTSDVSLCKVDPDDKIYKPLEMCYPVQTGPVMCTSDVEFGLVGKEAGTAVLQYNKYIATQRCDVKGTQKPCNAETMLDGLIRADALEIAAPDIFLPTNPSDKGQVAKLEKQKKILASLDKSYYMKWFDLVLAMIPVFRQDSSVSSRFINDLISLSVDDLQENFKSFLQGISTKNAAQVYTSFNKIAEIITAKTDDQRNDQSAKMFDEIFMEIRNHLKAAKSYHSFGAIRSINVASQMKHKEMINKISLNDYISSAIENFGHTQESMDKCLAKKPQSIPQCIAESSKYLWRTYSTLKAAKDILVDVGQGESLSEQAKMETVKARDYVAELFFIFKKNKKDLPSEYFSAMAYKEDIQLEEEGKNEMKAKTYKATELLKKFMKCDSGDSCMKKVSDAVVEYAKSMLAYQDKNSAWKKVILDKVINKHYFDYVTEPKDKIVNCYKDFLLGIKDPCQIKANTKDKATV